MYPLNLSAAFALDLLLGDPPSFPHPVRWIGTGIIRLERYLRRISRSSVGERRAGVLLAGFFVVSSYFFVLMTLEAAGRVHWLLAEFLSVYWAYSCLALKSLGDAARAVQHALEIPDLPLARSRLSHIVGRDTEKHSEAAVIRAAVETVAENTSDGIVAPLFYLVLGGPALAMVYKAINTLDSMVGYKNARYLHFGWAAARLDDAANWIPARITSLLMVISAGFLFRRGGQAWRVLWRDGRKHDSPNAGLPEAAAAGALGIQLGGPSFYGGVLKEKPWLGDNTQTPAIRSISEGIRLMRLTAVVAGFLAVMLCALLEGF